MKLISREDVLHILIIPCHPEPQSFNASMTRFSVKELEGSGHNVAVFDLYAEEFDPVERVDH